MLVSVVLALGFIAWIAWIVWCIVLSFAAKTRTRGLIALGVSLAVTSLLLWWGDSGRMVEEPPSPGEIIGTWECYDVSPGFLRNAGLDLKEFTSKLTFENASSIEVERMPDEIDTITFSHSWKLVPLT